LVSSKYSIVGPVHSAGRRAKKTWKNRSQPQNASDRSRSDNGMDVTCAVSAVQGAPTTAFSIATCCRGGIFLVYAGRRNGDQVGGQTRLSQLSETSLVCSTPAGAVVGMKGPQRLIQQKADPPAKPSPTRTGHPAQPEAIDALVGPFSVLQFFFQAEEISKRRMAVEIVVKRPRNYFLQKIGSTDPTHPLPAAPQYGDACMTSRHESTRVFPNLYPKLSLGHIIHMHKQSFQFQ
jgi:hypothetical protein